MYIKNHIKKKIIIKMSSILVAIQPLASLKSMKKKRIMSEARIPTSLLQVLDTESTESTCEYCQQKSYFCRRYKQQQYEQIGVGFGQSRFSSLSLVAT